MGRGGSPININKENSGKAGNDPNPVTSPSHHMSHVCVRNKITKTT